MKKIKPSERINGDEMKLEKLKLLEEVSQKFPSGNMGLTQAGIADIWARLRIITRILNDELK